MGCRKILMFIFNFIFALGGIAIVAIGALILHEYNQYNEFVDSAVTSAPIVLIVVGSVIFLIAFFGCCGAIRESHCMLMTFAFCLLVILILEVVGIVLVFMNYSRLDDLLKDIFQEALNNYNSSTELQVSWNVLQSELKCCGINGFTDWASVSGFPIGQLPSGCCGADLSAGFCAIGNVEYTVGCLPTLSGLMETNLLILGGVAIGIALIQAIGIGFACCLAKSSRR